MKTFNDLEFRHSFISGEISRLHFENGYGVSVVRGPHTYGGEDGLFELAVIDSNTDEITYNTPITDDVVGYLTPDGVTDIMAKIQSL